MGGMCAPACTVRLPGCCVPNAILRYRAAQADAALERAVEAADAKARRLIGDLDTRSTVFSTFGKNFIKSVGMSPDSFVQMVRLG